MVCAQPTAQQNNKTVNYGRIRSNSVGLGPTTTDNLSVAGNRTENQNNTPTMEFDELDKLELQYLAGANLVEHPPLFAPGGEFLFIRSQNVVYVYATATGVLARKLTGAICNLISMELELDDPETLVACSSAGELLRWHWQNGRLQRVVDLGLFDDQTVLTFNLLNLYGYSETACAFLTYRSPNVEHVRWLVVDTLTSEWLNVPCKLKLQEHDPLVAVGTKKFKYIAIVQDYNVCFINYKTWMWRRLFNAHRIPITVVRTHPLEETFITGDETGKIFIWREFMDPATVKTTLYHWHHTAVTSIAFTPSGTSFYSSGHEAVLVHWNIKRPDIRRFLPRMVSVIRQICTSDDNSQIAVCTADNGVQFVGTNNKVSSTLQEFTFIEDDKTGEDKFPVGLHLNPRTNTLVLNGKHGHLQFYSVYTKTMLYNMDIVMQNRLSMESDKVLYNIRVTKAAFNIDWMATGEVFDDKEHLPELRLKFWKYDEAAKTYTLNTNVELPHEGGFKAIEFSNANHVDNLLCATVGGDNIIKMWSLEESDNIYKKGKVWYCIAQTSYSDLSVESISFSQDGSVLAAGYGKTLCIYRSENLKLKAALTPPPGFDGVVPKIQVKLRKKGGGDSPIHNEFTPEKRKKWIELFNNFFEKNDDTLIKELDKFDEKCAQIDFKPEEVSAEEIDDETKKKLYKKIMDMHQLNFYHKILLFQRLGIRLNVHPQGRERILTYLYDTIMLEGQRERLRAMQEEVKYVNTRERYKAKWRLHEYEKRLNRYEAEVKEKLIPLMEVLDFGDDDNEDTCMLLQQQQQQQQQHTWPWSNGSRMHSDDPVPSTSTSTALTAKRKVEAEEAQNSEEDQAAEAVQNAEKGTSLLESVEWFNPVTAQISKVQFAAGEWAHLVIVCTERRVLIYNLLTLRIQATCKLSVKHLAFDPISNLVAAFTKYDELYVFQPNVPLPIYQRSDLPRLHGAAWLPRRHPKNRSIMVDWQAQSTLYFLTENQEIFYLGLPDSVDNDAPPPITFSNSANQALQYSTFGTFATQQHSDMQNSVRQPIGPLVIGNSRKMAVQSLINMSTHTMPPLSLLAADFVKSLLKTDNSAATIKEVEEKTEKSGKPKYHRRKMLNGGAAFMNGHSGGGSDDEDEEEEDDKDDAMENTTKSEAQNARAIDGDVEMDDEEVALKKRKSLIVKSEEISANAAKIGEAQKQRDIEAQLESIAAASLEIEF